MINSTAVDLPPYEISCSCQSVSSTVSKKWPCKLYKKSLPDTLALDEPKLSFLEYCLCWDITQKLPKVPSSEIHLTNSKCRSGKPNSQPLFLLSSSPPSSEPRPKVSQRSSFFFSKVVFLFLKGCLSFSQRSSSVAKKVGKKVSRGQVGSFVQSWACCSF